MMKLIYQMGLIFCFSHIISEAMELSKKTEWPSNSQPSQQTAPFGINATLQDVLGIPSHKLPITVKTLLVGDFPLVTQRLNQRKNVVFWRRYIKLPYQLSSQPFLNLEKAIVEGYEMGTRISELNSDLSIPTYSYYFKNGETLESYKSLFCVIFCPEELGNSLYTSPPFLKGDSINEILGHWIDVSHLNDMPNLDVKPSQETSTRLFNNSSYYSTYFNRTYPPLSYSRQPYKITFERLFIIYPNYDDTTTPRPRPLDQKDIANATVKFIHSHGYYLSSYQYQNDSNKLYMRHDYFFSENWQNADFFVRLETLTPLPKFKSVICYSDEHYDRNWPSCIKTIKQPPYPTIPQKDSQESGKKKKKKTSSYFNLSDL